MNPEQIIDFIRQQLIQGKNRTEIEYTLRINNVSEPAIATAFEAAKWQMNQNVLPPAARAGMRVSSFLIILILLLLASAASGYVIVFQPELVDSWLGGSAVNLYEPVMPIRPRPPTPPIVEPTATSTATTTNEVPSPTS